VSVHSRRVVDTSAVHQPLKISSLLTLERTRCYFDGSSPKRVLQNVARLVSETLPGLDEEDLFYRLAEREKIGSTAIGNGVAIPHCRTPNCPSILGILLKLPKGVDFSARDGQPVDLLFVLLVPIGAEEEHLRVLALLARYFVNPEFCRQLREADSDEALYQVAVEYRLSQ